MDENDNNFSVFFAFFPVQKKTMMSCVNIELRVKSELRSDTQLRWTIMRGFTNEPWTKASLCVILMVLFIQSFLHLIPPTTEWNATKIIIRRWKKIHKRFSWLRDTILSSVRRVNEKKSNRCWKIFFLKLTYAG